MANLNQHITRTISAETPSGFNPKTAGKALAKALNYIKNQWGWSGSKIAEVLHLNSRTLNAWLKNKSVPVESAALSPDIQAIVHLVAIHRSLSAMFASELHQKAWLETSHPELKSSPLEKMSESFDGLLLVRQYLDYSRGRGA